MRNFLRRRLGMVLIGVAVLLILSANRIATFLTDLWWFDALGYRSTFTTVLSTQVILGIVFGAALAALVAGNLMVVRRIRPLFVPSTPQQATIERYRNMADPYLPWLIVAVAVLFGFTAGAAVATQWEPFLLWQNAQEFGILDDQFNRDVGFFVFSLPWLKFVQTWLFTSLLLTLLLTVGAHYLLGGIRPENPGEKVMPNVKVHLSVLLALVLAARGWGYWLDRFMLNFSPRGQVTGASYTDVNAELPALNLLLIITAVAIGLVLWNVRRRGFLLPGVAIGILILASILLQGAYPAAIQRLRVEPQELARESRFIERNLTATRHAYRLDNVDFNQFPIANDLTEAQVRDNEVTVTNIRLWDPQVLQTTYAELQALRPYYQFNDVDVDRYMIDGELRQIMLSTRELDIPGLPSQAQTWQNQTLTYTHGFGVVASKVNTATVEGQPVFVAEDIPPVGEEELVPQEQAGIYYGERENPLYSIVATNNREIDYEDPETAQQAFTSYAGQGGVSVGNLFRRAMFAIRFSDPNVVLSNLLTGDSKLLMRRDVTSRVREVAPYLLFDRDPYPVVLDGRVKWIQDAYSHSNFYPYSERRVLNADVRAQVNYVRNSVKAVVDAYDGTVELYVIDEDDPVIGAWEQIFPDFYHPASELPQGLVEHFRYPEDLFTLQASVYTTYHIPEAAEFYSKADAWEIPADAAQLANRQDLSSSQVPLDPYYLLMRLPGQTDEEFVLIQPYKPRNQPIMVAWLAARSDPGKYGELFAVQFPTDQSPLGPSQVQARIEQEDQIAEYITLRDQRGSQVIRGNMLVLPIEESILYVEPLFLQNEQAEIPELDKVVVVMGSQVAFEDTLAEAIASLVGADEPVGDEPPPDDDDAGEDDPSADIGELVVQALELYNDAQDALTDGNLGRYQSLLQQMQRVLERMAAIEGVAAPTPQPTDGGTASPSPQPTETTSP
ncbi:MAG: UPF0182 family protein [Nitriliruptorales bacterium]|nr:UPF0182 family protein [Nitriliruptorales bacterium]